MNNEGVYQEEKMKLNQIHMSGNKKNADGVHESKSGRNADKHTSTHKVGTKKSTDGVHKSKSGRNADKHTNTPKVGTKKPSTVDPLPMPNHLFEIDITEDHKPPNTTTIITEEKGLKNPSHMVTGKLPGQEVILEVLVMKIPIS